ncbi:hypothetical protein MHYP_G00301720 [Metynnis hypsauchen]
MLSSHRTAIYTPAGVGHPDRGVEHPQDLHTHWAEVVSKEGLQDQSREKDKVNIDIPAIATCSGMLIFPQEKVGYQYIAQRQGEASSYFPKRRLGI